MKSYICKILFLVLIAVLCFQFVAWPQSPPGNISVAPNPSNNYDIPPGQSSNIIHFDVTMTNLSNQVCYGYDFALNDPSSWSTIQSSQIPCPTSGTVVADLALPLPRGTQTVYVRLWFKGVTSGNWLGPLSSASTSVTLTQYYSVTVQNSFGTGNVKVDGGTYASGTSFTWVHGSTHTLEAIDGQSSGGYVQRFDIWSGPNIPNPSSISNNINVTQNATYTANFKPEYNIVFQNSFPGGGNGGQIKVNGNQYNSPTANFPVVQGNIITGEVVNNYQVINGIEYTWNCWTPGGSGNTTETFTPSNHTAYSANFTAKPTIVPNFSVGGATGQNVQLNWSQHVNSNVTYQIWRRAKDRGNVDELLITLPHNTTSWTDNAYVIGSGIGSTSLSYDARAYFTPTGTTATPRWVFVSGIPDGPDPKKIPSPLVQHLTDLPAEYVVGVYPNPFNPSTTISYQLVENALVALTVYDMMGREIVTLVQAEKSAGYHSVQWNGRDSYDNPAATGVYMYRFTATRKSGKETVFKSGKLLLAK